MDGPLVMILPFLRECGPVVFFLFSSTSVELDSHSDCIADSTFQLDATSAASKAWNANTPLTDFEKSIINMAAGMSFFFFLFISMKMSALG